MLVFRPDLAAIFIANRNEMHFGIKGRPLPWKRPAGGIYRYDQQRAQKRKFISCIKLLFEFHGRQFIQFGRRDVALRVTYIINRQWEADIDNLAKFTMDCLQLEQMIDGNIVRVFDKDICVRKLVAEKRYALSGEQLSTTVHILPYVLLVE